MKEKIYLDYNATAPLRPAAFEAIARVLQTPHNASSVHGLGREARKLIEASRIQVAALAGAAPAQVIFNSGATEGNNTLLKFFAGERVLISAVEHPSVREVLPNAEKIPVKADGVVDLDSLEDLLKEKKTGLVSVMHANNETGVLQPVPEIAALAHKYGALFHCDGAQAAGKIPVDMAASGIDFLTLSAHKIGGPQGAGALILGLCGIMPILLEGGGQEKGARAGTENIAGIAGFGAAAQEALADLRQFQNQAVLRDRLESELKILSPEIVIHGEKAPRLPNTSFFSLPGASSETLLMSFDLEHICLSNGSACASGTVKPSGVLKAMGCGDSLARSALRISTGWNTQAGDIDRFLAAWQKIRTRLAAKPRETHHA